MNHINVCGLERLFQCVGNHSFVLFDRTTPGLGLFAIWALQATRCFRRLRFGCTAHRLQIDRVAMVLVWVIASHSGSGRGALSFRPAGVAVFFHMGASVGAKRTNRKDPTPCLLRLSVLRPHPPLRPATACLFSTWCCMCSMQCCVVLDRPGPALAGCCCLFLTRNGLAACARNG